MKTESFSPHSRRGVERQCWESERFRTHGDWCAVLRVCCVMDWQYMAFFFLFFPLWFQADTQHFYSDLRIRDDLSVCLRLCFCRIELAQSVLAYPSLWVHSGGVLTMMMMMMMTMISANRYELHVCFECRYFSSSNSLTSLYVTSLSEIHALKIRGRQLRPQSMFYRIRPVPLRSVLL